MKSWKIITAITLAVIAVALVATVAFASAYNPYRVMTPNLNTGFFGGMMGTYISTPSQVGSPVNSNQYGTFGRGCMGFGRSSYLLPSYVTNTTTTLTIDQATQIAQRYVIALNNPDLKITDVQEYSNSFYVQVGESSTGMGAFELTVDKYTGNIYPEMGPNMMWNTKYTTTTGMMGIFNGLRGMMGLQRTPSTQMTVTADQAKADAQQYLNTYYPGTNVGNPTTFYGYYNIEVLSQGQPYGMVSVNGYTGQVWYHTWLGSFLL